MKITSNKIASALAFIIGTMAFFADRQVLTGKDPGYYVIDWLRSTTTPSASLSKD